MKIYTHITAIVVSAAVLAGAAPVFITADSDEAAPVNVSEFVRSHVESGDLAVAQHEYVTARQAYSIAANWVRADGRLPVEEMRRIANAYYFEGRYLSAMDALDQLAEEAGAFGDHVMQAWAIADAAYLADLAGSKMDVEARLEHLESLLGSFAISDVVSLEIKAKVAKDFPVFAPHLSSW